MRVLKSGMDLVAIEIYIQCTSDVTTFHIRDRKTMPDIVEMVISGLTL